jgi:tetratricopeptide (TPR) repeat protein
MQRVGKITRIIGTAGAILFWALAVPLQGGSSVKVWEDRLVIPTYLTGEPEKLPFFYSGRAYQGAKGPVYPYPMIDKLTDVRENRTYKALYLENDYIKICVLPEIGGRIFSAVDKTDDYDFFYRQQVIKPALIGMLGAWISGGVEWNFPHHHRATGFMPVDYALAENPDGSKTIWVGEIERRHRTKWIIGLTLYPGRSYLEATVKLFNRTPLAHSVLYWANVAVHATEDYQIIFPPGTEYATFHGKNQFARWPLCTEVFNGVDYSRGVDISWYKNHPAPTSFFAWKDEEDFLAGYDHGKEAGVVHVTDHHVAPGKKFWTWGTGSQGRMWEKILTDEDGPYIELMVGAFSDNQPDYSWLQPYEARVVKQYWFPLRGIRGVKRANPEAAVNLEPAAEGRLRIGVNTTAAWKGAKIVLTSGRGSLWEKTLDIAPDHPYYTEIEPPDGVEENDLELGLYSPTGQMLISYAPVKAKGSPFPEAVKPPLPPEEIKTVDELYHAGLRLEQFHNPALEPEPYYEEALKRDPDNYQVNTVLAILYLKQGLFARAEERLIHALRRATKNYTRPKDGEAYYYLGLALRAQHRYEEAFDAFYRATWSLGWAAAGYYSLAALASSRGDYTRALEFLDRSLSLNGLNLGARNLKATLMRRQGRVEGAAKVTEIVLQMDPLNFWACNERNHQLKALGAGEEEDVGLEKMSRRMGDAVQNHLELAVEYGNCGLWDEALGVLDRMTDQEGKKPGPSPLAYYYMGYYLDKEGRGSEALEAFRKACRMPPDYCFPFRWETIDALSRAQELNPGDARAPYYLGNLLFDLQPEEAIEQWEKSAALDADFALVQRNLGLAFARVKNDVSRAIECMERARKLAVHEPRIIYELDLLYEAAGLAPEKRVALMGKNQETVSLRDDSLAREIGLLLQSGRYDRALELLETHHFHVWEGGGRIHDVYVDAHLLRGQLRYATRDYGGALQDYMRALEYPENLEVGKPLRGGEEPRAHYFAGTACEALGDEKRALEHYQKSTASPQRESESSYYQGMALLNLGCAEEAERMFEGLERFARKRLKDSPEMDFFAKFGERQSASYRRAQAHYLLGLSFLGKGEEKKARAEFAEALRMNINHLWAAHYLALIDDRD